MPRWNIFYAPVLVAIMILLLQSPLYAQGRWRVNLNTATMTNAVQREYKDYVAKITFVHDEIKKSPPSKEGTIFVSDILKYKGQRRHLLKSTNDAEALLAQAIESIKAGDHGRAFTLTKEAIEKDVTYMRAHFLLAGLYEERGDITDMWKQYRYYLKKTLFIRKMMQAKTGWPDIELDFIKEKFARYNISVREPGLMGVNMLYILIGVVCVTIMLVTIIFLLRKASR